jgi:hypothetical protein
VQKDLLHEEGVAFGFHVQSVRELQTAFVLFLLTYRGQEVHYFVLRQTAQQDPLVEAFAPQVREDFRKGVLPVEVDVAVCPEQQEG